MHGLPPRRLPSPLPCAPCGPSASCEDNGGPIDPNCPRDSRAPKRKGGLEKSGALELRGVGSPLGFPFRIRIGRQFRCPLQQGPYLVRLGHRGRRLALLVLSSAVRPPAQKELDDLGVAALGRKVERRLPLARPPVHVEPSVDKHPEKNEVRFPHGHMARRGRTQG